MLLYFSKPLPAEKNQHGVREDDDLQHWLDMTSRENPLYFDKSVNLHYNRITDLSIYDLSINRFTSLYFSFFQRLSHARRRDDPSRILGCVGQWA